MNATGDADLENWYNYLERIQKRMVKKNLRYLLSVIFQAGVRTGEVDEVPKIKVEFNPLWSLSDTEQADLDQKRAQTQFTRAQAAQLYIDKQVIDPSEFVPSWPTARSSTSRICSTNTTTRICFPTSLQRAVRFPATLGKAFSSRASSLTMPRAPAPKSTRKTPAETVKLPPPHLLRPSCRRT